MLKKQLLSYKLDTGEKIFIEIDDDSERISKGTYVEASDRLEDALKHISPVAQRVMDSLRDINNPDEINMEFGLKFSAQAGVVFTSVNSDVTFKVSVKWKNA